MVSALTDDELDEAFAALADRTRRAILARLARGDASVMELAEPFAMSQPAISKHLAVLERASLVSRRREGQRRPCHLEPERLAHVTHWLGTYREFWEASYARLDELLEDLQGQPDKEDTRDRQEARDHRRPARAHDRHPPRRRRTGRPRL